VALLWVAERGCRLKPGVLGSNSRGGSISKSQTTRLFLNFWFGFEA
jgi:hypothetical protein